MAEKKVTENEAAPKKTVKKTITKVDSAKATTPAEKPSTKTAAKAATPVTAADKSSAKTKRILAVVFWVLAIACEVLAVLVFIGKIDLKFISQMAQLIAFLVIDFILVVVGAQFWKQANHMDPVSEQNKVKFWLWNNMGVIVCCFAFIPFLIYVLFIDKNADPKMKKVAAIVAAVALVLGIGISYDWNPVSEEGKATIWIRNVSISTAVPSCSKAMWQPQLKKERPASAKPAPRTSTSRLPITVPF